MKNKKILVSIAFILLQILILSTVSAASAQNTSSEPTYTYIICGNSNNGTLYIVNTTTNIITDRVSLGKWPSGVIVSPDEAKVYVTNVGNGNSEGNSAVYVIDTITNNVSVTMNAGNDHSAIAHFIDLISPKSVMSTENLNINTTSKNMSSKTNKPPYSSKWILTFNESGIPIVDYGYVKGVFIGKQLNPVTISNTALSLESKYQKGNESCKQLFLNNANYLVENAVQHDNYTLWQYNFSWPVYEIESPWISGMAQGLGVQVLTRAYNMTGDKKYLDSAHLGLNSFFVEVKDGGITYKDQNGWWYEEYASRSTDVQPRVLNGMVFALVGIYEYYESTGDQDAKFIFDQGIVSLKDNLYKYDAGNWTYYDALGNNRASMSYHKLHIDQMLQLYEITKDPFFKDYYEKFQEYYQNSTNNINQTSTNDTRI